MKRFSLLIGLGAVAVLLLFVYMLFDGFSLRQQSSMEVAQIPLTDMAVMYGTVLPSGEALLIGLTFPPFTNQKYSVVLASNGAYRKILVTDPCDPPGVANPMRGSITRDGRRLLLGLGNGYINPNRPVRVADIRAGRWLCSNSNGPVIESSWNPLSQDGSRFLGARQGSGKNGLYLHDTSTGKPLLNLTKGLPVNSTLSDYGFLPGYREVQCVEESPTSPRRVWRVHATGEKPRLMGEISRQEGLYTSPDGSRFAFVRDYATSLGRKTVVLGQIGLMSSNCKYLGPLYTMAKDEDIMSVNWSPDGHYLAVLSHPGKPKVILPFVRPKPRFDQVVIIYVPAGKVVARFKNPEYDLMLLDWYPDSKSVLCGYQTETHTVLQKLSIKNSR